MGYHIAEIKRGVLGEFSKIEEEFQELEDGVNQGNPILMLVEMSDMLGAIEAYANSRGINLYDLIRYFTLDHTEDIIDFFYLKSVFKYSKEMLSDQLLLASYDGVHKVLGELISVLKRYARNWNVSFDDLIKMKNCTASAFRDGTRKPRE